MKPKRGEIWEHAIHGPVIILGEWGYDESVCIPLDESKSVSKRIFKNDLMPTRLRESTPEIIKAVVDFEFQYNLAMANRRQS